MGRWGRRHVIQDVDEIEAQIKSQKLFDIVKGQDPAEQYQQTIIEAERKLLDSSRFVLVALSASGEDFYIVTGDSQADPDAQREFLAACVAGIRYQRDQWEG